MLENVIQYVWPCKESKIIINKNPTTKQTADFLNVGILIFSLFLKIFLKHFKNLALELTEYLKSRLYDIDIVIISLSHHF